MTVQRYDLNSCIGCETCHTVCPLDVFRFDYEKMKSVIAYPENCQNCGQCYINCQGQSLEMARQAWSFPITSTR